MEAEAAVRDEPRCEAELPVADEAPVKMRPVEEKAVRPVVAESMQAADLPAAEMLPSGSSAESIREVAPAEHAKASSSAEESSRERDAADLDTAKADAVLKPMQALPGLLAHTVGNLVGGATLGAGWALGKADVAAGPHLRKLSGNKEAPAKVADSGAFKLGFRTWLYANGVWPTVLCEKGPYGNDIGPLPQDPQARRRFLRSTALIVSNHVSYLDTVVLPLVLEVPKLMAMAEVANWPLFGQLCQEMDMIWVDRSDPSSRSAAKQAITDHVKDWSYGERPLLIWPEGTTSNGRGLKEFKTGSFAPGVAVRPVVIKYTGDWDPSNVNFREAPGEERSEDSSPGSTDYGDAEWAQQFLGHIIHSCTVLICRPYHPSAAEVADPELFKANVRELMRQRLQELHEQEERKRAEKERASGNPLFGRVDKLIGLAGGLAGRGLSIFNRQQ